MPKEATKENVIKALRECKLLQSKSFPFLWDQNNEKIVACCGLGAIAIGLGYTPINRHDLLENGAYVYHLIPMKVKAIKFTDSYPEPISDIIWKLNDLDRLSFTEIADWLERHWQE